MGAETEEDAASAAAREDMVERKSGGQGLSNMLLGKTEATSGLEGNVGRSNHQRGVSHHPRGREARIQNAPEDDFRNLTIYPSTTMTPSSPFSRLHDPKPATELGSSYSCLLMSRLRSLQSPSPQPSRPSPSQSSPKTPSPSNPFPHDTTTYHRKLRALVTEIRVVMSAWDEECKDAFMAGKGAVDEGTEIE